MVLAATMLLLAFTACGAHTDPGAATTAIDLSSFAVAFDLTDLSQYLSEPQLAAVESAVRDKLISRGYASENFALFFDKSTEDSIKIPFDNAGGLDLARLDADKLANSIAGQIEATFVAQGVTQVSKVTLGQLNPEQSPSSTFTSKPNLSTTGSTTRFATTTKAPTTHTSAAPNLSGYPSVLKKTDVNYVIPQGTGDLNKTITYDRFSDAPIFSITNNQGKELYVRLRPADRNNPSVSYADLYTDPDGDTNYDWQRAMQCNVSTEISLGGAYEGSTHIITDSNFKNSYVSDSTVTMPVIRIYWTKESGAAQIFNYFVKEISQSEYRRLQNAGSGVYVVKCTDGTNAAYYK